jgi:hypothetical protein
MEGQARGTLRQYGRSDSVLIAEDRVLQHFVILKIQGAVPMSSGGPPQFADAMKEGVLELNGKAIPVFRTGPESFIVRRSEWA